MAINNDKARKLLGKSSQITDKELSRLINQLQMLAEIIAYKFIDSGSNK